MPVKCPLCDSESTLKHSVSSYKYYFCSRCDLLFLAPYPNEKQINRYYKKLFNYPAGKTNKITLTKRSQSIIKNLVKLYPKGSKLLDIGSGLGYFLNEADKLGLKTTGIEPSKQLIKDSIYRNSKTIFNGTFEEYLNNHKQERFDYITLVHVIEHVKKPKELIKAALKLLNKGGILYMETPNLDSHLYYAERKEYTFLTPPDHLWIFSAKALIRIIPHKYTNTLISTYSYPEHLMGIIKRKLKRKHYLNEHSMQSKSLDHQKETVRTRTFIKSIKYGLFDQFLARIFHPLLNINYHGSILELYIKKI